MNVKMKNDEENPKNSLHALHMCNSQDADVFCPTAAPTTVSSLFGLSNQLERCPHLFPLSLRPVAANNRCSFDYYKPCTCVAAASWLQTHSAPQHTPCSTSGNKGKRQGNPKGV